MLSALEIVYLELYSQTSAQEMFYPKMKKGKQLG